MYPEVTMELNPPYNGTYGASRLINQTIDVLFSSRELRPVDITNFRAKFGYDPLIVPISGSDVVTTTSCLNNFNRCWKWDCLRFKIVTEEYSFLSCETYSNAKFYSARLCRWHVPAVRVPRLHSFRRPWEEPAQQDHVQGARLDTLLHEMAWRSADSYLGGARPLRRVFQQNHQCVCGSSVERLRGVCAPACAQCFGSPRISFNKTQLHLHLKWISIQNSN